jgi:hypothetical protein
MSTLTNIPQNIKETKNQVNQANYTSTVAVPTLSTQNSPSITPIKDNNTNTYKNTKTQASKK